MDAAHKREGSYEGSGLSVSLHPEDWAAIARLGGNPTWKLVKPGNVFLNFHRMNKGHRRLLRDWAIQQGYVEAVPTFRAWYYDADYEDMAYMTFTDRQEADDHIEFYSDEYDDTDPHRARVEEIPGGGIRAMPTLFSRCKQTSGEILDDVALDLIASVYAEDVLRIDGVWWNDTYDPQLLSAPRGVIVPSMVHTWQAERAY